MSAVAEPVGAASPQAGSAERAAAARAARTKRLLEGPIGPTLLALAAPNVVAMFAQAATSIAEGAFAGRLGIASLAGLALVFPLFMLTQMLSAGSMGGAISAAVARALGAGEPERAGRLAFAAGFIALGFAAASALLVALFGRALFELIGGGPGAPVEEALSYAAVFFPACATVWLCHATLSVLRGTGNMATPSTVLLLVSVASIPLSGALGLGLGPFPALGMAGLALGVAIAHAGGAAVALWIVGSGRAGLPLAGALGRLRRSDFREILGVGLVSSLNAVQTIVTITLMVALVSRFGEAALAGYGLGARLEFLLIPIVFGVGAALVAMVGANVGAGNRARALRVAWTGAFAAAGIVGAIGLLVALAPGLWLGIFLGPEAAGAWAAGAAYFRIVAPFYAFFGLGLALYFASQGAGRMVWPIVGSCVRMALAFGLGLALVSGGSGVEGVFLGVAAGMIGYGIVTALAVKLTAWR